MNIENKQDVIKDAEGQSHLTDVFATVDDLAALVARLAHSLRQAAPDNDLPDKAVDYLRRKGLQGSPLRKVANASHEGPDGSGGTLL
jgi:hypothetical protein